MDQLARRFSQAFQFWNLPASALAALLGLALCHPVAVAQSGAGSIQGTVADSSGAVIPGAEIHVVNNATGVVSDTRSNGVGFYLVPDLFTGSYTMTVSSPQMRTYRVDVSLLVDQHAEINLSLSAGPVTEQVQVAGNVEKLTTTDSGTITSTLESTRIDQLPMNGRSLLTLAGMVTPGLEDAGTRANGLLQQGMNYMLDGTPSQNRLMGTEQPPDPDAVQEVSIETENPSAQFTEPAVALVTTKSGTNGLHASFFETMRNNYWGIAKGRQNPAVYAAPELIRNEFGASAGGPIILPKLYHGKDKSFWFFAYERYSLAQISDYLVTVPTVAMRGGDFSGLINSSSVLQQLYDPSTTALASNCNGTGTANNYCRAPFVNNQIPVTRRNALDKLFNDITPLPTTADNPLVTSNFTFPGRTLTITPTFTLRLDHSFNESNKAYLRYGQTVLSPYGLSSTSYAASIAADGLPANITGTSWNPTTTFAGAVGYTHVFSPTLFAETILSEDWGLFTSREGDNSYEWNTPFATNWGLPNNFGRVGAPGIMQGGGIFQPFQGTQTFFGTNQTIINLDENVTKIVGRHQMFFGFRYRHEQLHMIPQESQDSGSFTADTTGLELPSSGANYSITSNTGNANADEFLGSLSSYSVRLYPPWMHFQQQQTDGYFQDNYHMTQNFTLNIGVRWEAHPATTNSESMFNSFDLKNDAMVTQEPMSYYISKGLTTQALLTNLTNLGIKVETPAEAGMSNKLFNNYDAIIDPRVGLAWQPFGAKIGTVLRAGYGRYSFPIPMRGYFGDAVPENFPFSASYTQNYDSGPQTDGLPNYQLRAPQPVFMGVNSANMVNSSTTTAILPGGVADFAVSPNIHPNLATELTVTLEQAMKAHSALRVSWVWAHGSDLDKWYYYNNHPSTYVWELAYGIVPPTGTVIGSNQYSATATGPYDQTTWGSNVWDSTNGWSNDNALQVNYQRLFHRGIAWQMSYVWSKPMRMGGNQQRDSVVDTVANYQGVLGSVGTMTSPFGTVVAPNLPPRPPTGTPVWAEYHALDVFEGYKLDSAIPLQHITFNGIVDLPVGRGKKFLGSANRFVNDLVGGFQLAGDGNIVSQDFQPAFANFGPNNPIQVYKHKAPITDCRSGVCHASFEWFDGYIAPTANGSLGCTSKCVYGLPSNWQPYQTPIDNVSGTTNYGTNNVQVTAPTLNSGNPVTVGYSPGPYNVNRYAKTFIHGPMNWTADASLFKVFPITERVNLRFNMDAFNVFNDQGYNNPNTTDGTEAYQPNGVASSYNAPRQVQFTMRLTF